MKKKTKLKIRIFTCILAIIMVIGYVKIESFVSAAGSSEIILDNISAADSCTEYSIIEKSGYKVVKIIKGGSYILSQNSSSSLKRNIIIDSDEPVDLVLNGINITAGNYTENSVFNSNVTTGTAAISVENNSVCTLILKDGTQNIVNGISDTSVANSLKNVAAISVENTIANNQTRLATLIIKGENGQNSTGKLEANGGNQSAAIGGNCNRLTGNITIESGNITAKSGDYGAAIGDGDTANATSPGGAQNDNLIWTVGKTNSTASISINGGYVKAIATKDTPGIGTSDNLNKSSNATTDIWNGLIINISGGTIVTVGGEEIWSPSAAIGAGSGTYIEPSNIIVDDGSNTISVTRTNDGSYPITNSGGNNIPAINTDSTANVLNIKFDSGYSANDINFWKLVDGIYEKIDSNDFPNDVLEDLGDINILGLAVALPDGTYKITDDAGNSLGNNIQLYNGGFVNVEESEDGIVVANPPTVTNPTDVNINSGESAEFTVEATKGNDTGIISYQWYKSTDNGTTWNKMNGEIYNTLSIYNVTANDDGNLYKCTVEEIFNGEKLSATSQVAKLSVTQLYNVSIEVKKNEQNINSNTFEVFDENGNSNGILNYNANNQKFSANLPEGKYTIESNTENIKFEINVDSLNTVFVKEYYTVSLKVTSVYQGDAVIINQNSYTNNDNSYEFILLKGENLNLKSYCGTERDIYAFKINNADISKESLKSASGYTINSINSQKNIIVEFGALKHESNIKVNKDDSILNNELPNIILILGDSEYDLDDDLPNGEYRIIIDGEDSGKVVDVIDGNANITFYKVLLTGDNGIDSVSGSGVYLKDTNVNISAVLKSSGYNFKGWYDLGDNEFNLALSNTISNIDKTYELKAVTEAIQPSEPQINGNGTSSDFGSENGNDDLTVNVLYDEQNETISYQWYECDENGNNRVIINGENNPTYTPDKKDAGTYYFYIEVTVERIDNGEKIVDGTVIEYVINKIDPTIIVSNEDVIIEYTGEETSVGVDTNVIGKNNEQVNSNIIYTYYTDEECTVPTRDENGGASTVGGEPKNPGLYYVKITSSETNNYNEASKIIKLTINKTETEEKNEIKTEDTNKIETKDENNAEKNDTEKKPIELPKTGDNIKIWFIIMALSMLCIFIIIKKLNKSKDLPKHSK